MFRGEESVTFDSELSGKELLSFLEECLEPLGEAFISEQGEVIINPRSLFGGNLCQSTITGRLRKRGEKYRISIEYDSTLSTVGWFLLILGILLYLLGLLVLLSPYSASKKIEKVLRRVLSEMNPGEPLFIESF